jgi:hypothetical protein
MIPVGMLIVGAAIAFAVGAAAGVWAMSRSAEGIIRTLGSQNERDVQLAYKNGCKHECEKWEHKAVKHGHAEWLVRPDSNEKVFVWNAACDGTEED